MSDYFHSGVALTDPLIGDALARELHRQQTQIELIASENIVSQAVLDALAHPITNKTLEGYPGHRFHGGGEFVDIVEQAAIDRAKELFNCNYANVQPHSGTQANQAVFFATVKPGDKILSLNLAAGGHLSHGAAPNLSGRWFDSHHYGVDKESGLIDYDEAERLAKAIRPKLLIAGGSAYPRIIDFERLGFIAKSVDALLLVDMAHFAGLVAAGVHPSPLPFADIVTCTTTKTMRGPRGGIILARESSWAKKLQSAIFPGVQGSLHSQIIAAKAVCLGEALGDDFKGYGRQVIDNAKTLARVLLEHGIKLVSGGTDTHMVLLDFSSRNLTGQQVQDTLAKANITSNKNPIPFDSNKPSEWSGLRLGVSAATTRGLGSEEFNILGAIITRLIDSGVQENEALFEQCRNEVLALCDEFPIYQEIVAGP
ncbi:MAG: serine hydroxymethyltransferase [Gammaproteobacteria bacterium]|nr:serine hydroxymethyltransferase [Gammaproteobacteria bacterium]MCZ6797413.1 serine hydroxymethyltransferase [Gammaproteobacteria bacterium]